MHNKRLFVVLLITGLLLYCFLFQGKRGLFEKDEGRYTAIALEMISSGDWLHPRIHREQDHFNKPPLTYWLIATSIKIFGKTEWAARFPSAVSFLGCIIAAFFLGRIFVPQQPLTAAIVYATFFFVVTASNMVTTDGVLTFFEVSAVTAFAYAFWSDPKKRTLSLLLMWLFFSLAFLTKGPPGLLPLLSICAFLVMANKNNRTIKLNWFMGSAVFLVIGCSWFIAVSLEHSGLASYFLKQEVVNRVFSDEHKRNANWYAVFYIYVPILLMGSLPWTKHVWAGMMQMIKRLRGGLAQEFSQDDGKNLFLLLWFALPLTVFVMAQSRLALYVLPLFAPLAIVASRELARRKFAFDRARGWIILWCLLMVLVRFVGGRVALRQDASWMAREIRKATDRQFNEIIFADKRPILGLKFYLDADVKAISFLRTELEDEMKKNAVRLWVIKPIHAKLFREQSENSGHSVYLVNELHWDKTYYLFMEGSGN